MNSHRTIKEKQEILYIISQSRRPFHDTKCRIIKEKVAKFAIRKNVRDFGKMVGYRRPVLRSCPRAWWETSAMRATAGCITESSSRVTITVLEYLCKSTGRQLCEETRKLQEAVRLHLERAGNPKYWYRHSSFNDQVLFLHEEVVR